jgi:hypothetical protein
MTPEANQGNPAPRTNRTNRRNPAAKQKLHKSSEFEELASQIRRLDGDMSMLLGNSQLWWRLQGMMQKHVAEAARR